MLIAVPSMIFIADSMSYAFKSAILVSAISLIVALDIVATVSFLPLVAPFCILAYFFKRNAAGGVFNLKS